MKKFKVTFKENTKWKPNTRTILVETTDPNSAESLIVSEFGSWSRGENGMRVSSKRIEIIKTKEVKEEAN